jgi:hypothetical protein
MGVEVRYSANLEGFWRIVELGGIILSQDGDSDPFVRIFVRRLARQEGSRDDLILEPQLHHVDLPLGETPFLPKGAILCDNVAVSEPPADLQRLEIELSFGTDHDIARRKDIPELHGDGRIHRSLSSADRSRLDELLYIRGRTSESIPFLVSCHEVFRFYYLISSRLGRLVTSSKILEPQCLYSASKTKGPGDDGRMQVAVKRGLLPSDVPIVAQWIASGHGLRSAQAIVRHISAQLSIRKVSTIRAVPPVVGTTRWTVLGRMMGERLLIYEIVSCSFPFAYSTLEWCYVDDEAPPEIGKNKGPPDEAPKPVGAVKGMIAPFPFVLLKGGNQPEKRFTSWVIPMGDLAARFAGLPTDGVSRVRPITNSDGRERRKQRKVPTDPTDHSGRAQGSQGTSGRQQVEFTSGYAKRASHGDASNNEPFAELKYTLALCQSLEERGLQWIDRVDDRDRYAFDGRQFNMVPKGVEGAKKRFVYIDDAHEHMRPVYIAEFEKWGAFGYLLEAARKEPAEKFCTLLFRTANREQLPAAALTDVLRSCAVRGRAAISDDICNLWALSVYRFLHLAERDAEERAGDVFAILDY